MSGRVCSRRGSPTLRARLRALARVAVLLLACCLPAAGRAQQPTDPYVIGLEHFYAGRYAEALPYFVTALDLAEERYGDDAPEIATDLNNLAELYRLLGRYDEAEPLYERALAIDEARSGSTNPDLAASLNNLALLYRAQGRDDEAERLYKRSLGLLEDAYGYSHPQVAMSLNNLAKLYEADGHPERARPLLERAARIAGDTLGPSHPSTQRIVRNLAALDGSGAVDGDPLGFELRPLPRPGSVPATPAASAQPRPDQPAPQPEPETGVEATPPAPPVAQPAPVAVPKGFAIHLASVRSPGAAKDEWARLAAELDLAPEIQEILPERVEIPGKGVFYRVAGGPFATRAEAAAACAPIAAQDQYCAVLDLDE